MPDMQILTVPLASKGMSSELETVGRVPGYCARTENLYIEDDYIRKRRGYSKMGSSSLPLTGTGKAILNYKDSTGTSHLIVLTTTNAYEYNKTSDNWTEITPDAHDFYGGVDDRWSWTIATDVANFTGNGGSALIICDGYQTSGNGVWKYQGHTSDKFTALEDASTLMPKEVIEWWNYLFFAHYYGSAWNAKSLAHSAYGNVKEWDLVDYAGFYTLYDTIGKIQRAKKLGLNLVIYSERSITEGRYLGDLVLFTFPTLIHEIGLYAPNALVEYGNTHFFAASDQRIYAYLGGVNILPIGLPIERGLFEVADPSKKARMTFCKDTSRYRLMLFYCSVSETYPKTSYTVNYKREGFPWEIHTFQDSVRGMELYENQASSYYVDQSPYSTTYCDQTTIYCDDQYVAEGGPLTVFLSDDGYVYKMDELDGKDDGANIYCEYDTGDITIDDEEHFARWQWFSFTAKSDIPSSTFGVAYSIDSGQTWVWVNTSGVQSSENIELETHWSTHRLPVDVLSRRIRFKIMQSSSGDIKIRGPIRIGFVMDTESD